MCIRDRYCTTIIFFYIRFIRTQPISSFNTFFFLSFTILVLWGLRIGALILVLWLKCFMTVLPTLHYHNFICLSFILTQTKHLIHFSFCLSQFYLSEVRFEPLTLVIWVTCFTTVQPILHYRNFIYLGFIPTQPIQSLNTSFTILSLWA